MNSKALRSTANKNIAKRIVEFMDPKNIVDNPRRVSKGNFAFLETINRKFSLNNETKDGAKDATKDDSKEATNDTTKVDQ